jgi:hypothetical protein
MSTIKNQNHRPLIDKRKKEWLVIVYFWTFGPAIRGYTLSKVRLSGLPHAYHWTTGIIDGMAGVKI